MNSINEIAVVKKTKSTFFNLVSLLFKREANEFKWDILDTFNHDEVFVIIFNRTRNTLVCTKKFRPGLYYSSIPDSEKLVDQPIDIIKYPLSNGFGVEFCAGVIDRTKTLEQIAVNLIREECGYKIKECNLEKIIVVKGGIEQTLFYVDVTDQLKIPIYSKNVELIEYTIPQVKDIIARSEFLNGSSSFIFGLMWFLLKKNPEIKY